jgi:hypothetical protein
LLNLSGSLDFGRARRESCKTSIPGSNPGGASNFSSIKRAIGRATVAPITVGCPTLVPVVYGRLQEITGLLARLQGQVDAVTANAELRALAS